MGLGGLNAAEESHYTHSGFRSAHLQGQSHDHHKHKSPILVQNQLYSIYNKINMTINDEE